MEVKWSVSTNSHCYGLGRWCPQESDGVKELFHPLHFSQCASHAAARPLRSRRYESKKTRSFLLLLLLEKYIHSQCIQFVQRSLVICFVNNFFHSTPDGLIRKGECINTFYCRQMSHSAAESEESWQSRKRKGGKLPIPTFSLSHLKQLLELCAAFTTLFISSLLVWRLALIAILYRDLLDFNNPSIESQSGCAYTRLTPAPA